MIPTTTAEAECDEDQIGTLVGVQDVQDWFRQQLDQANRRGGTT